MAAARQQMDMFKNGLMGKKLAEEWIPTIENIAAKFPDATLTLQTTTEPNFKDVQEILGKEDATEESSIRRNIRLADEVTVIWHKYGWCHFAVADGKVIRLRADCKAIKR